MRYNNTGNRSIFGIAVLIAAGLSALLVGVVIAVLPPGVVVRLLLPTLFLAGVVIAWAGRVEDGGAPLRVLSVLVFLVVALSILWPRYLFLHAGGLPGINPLTLSTMGLLALLVFSIAASPKVTRLIGEQAVNGGWTLKIAIAWLAWRFFASILGEHPVLSVIDLLKESVYVTSFLLFGLFASSLHSGPERVIRTIVGCGLLVSIVGVYEAFAQRNPFVGLISNMGDAAAPQALMAIAAEKIRDGGFRAQSTFDHPIVFAQFVAGLLPLALFTWKHDSKFLWRLIGLVTFPVGLLAIAKAGSRAGYVSIVGALILIGLVWWVRALLLGRTSKAIAIIALPAVAALIPIAWYVAQEFAVGKTQHEFSSTAVRLGMLSDGIYALWDSPLTGFGHGMALFKAGIVNSFGLATIDSYLLSIALDYGYVGLLLFLGFLASFSIGAFRFAVSGQSYKCALVGACFASVMALLTTFAVVSIYQNMTMLWLLVCIVFPIWTGNTAKIAPNRAGS